MKGFIQSVSFDHLIICGDFNIDFNHACNSLAVITTFMDDLNLISVDCNTGICYTYFRDDHLAKSCPDHILTYSKHARLINTVSPLDCSENFSDHLPLSFYLSLSLPPSLPLATSTTSACSAECALDNAHRVSWSKVTPILADNFRSFVVSNIPSFPDELFACCDPMCTQHFYQLDSLCAVLHDCLQLASDHYLPHVSNKSKSFPSWNDSASNLKHSTKLWHCIWSDCGCLQSGVVFQLKKKAKSRYKYEVHHLRRRQHHNITREKVGSALSQGRSRDFWRELQLMKKKANGSNASPVLINGESSDVSISELHVLTEA